MDSLDFAILRELVRAESPTLLLPNARKPLRAIARRLQVDKDTVRNRIKKFHETGFLRGWAIFPNPNLLGSRMVYAWFDIPSPSAKEDLMRKLKLIHGVLVIINHFGSSLCVVLLYESELSLKTQIELISRLSNAENFLKADIPFPECRVALSKVDWRIIESLQRNPQKTNVSISRELGVSSRTVKRRLESLVEGRVIFMIPRLNPKAMDATQVDLLVFYVDPKERSKVNERIMSRFGAYLVRAELGDAAHGFFNLIIRNVAEAQEISSWVREQSGILKSRVDLVQDRIELYESIEELLERKLAQIKVSV